MKNIKTTKKITALFLAALIVFTFSFNVFAAKTVTFTTYNAEVFSGDEFSVDIFVSDNSLMKTATLIVSYDERQMTFLDLNVGAIAASGSDAVSFKDVKGTSGDSFVQIEYNDPSASLSSAGKLFSLTFAATDSAKGQTNIKLSAKGDKIDTLSGAVTPKFNNSEINIINNSVSPSSETTPPPEESSSDVSESAQESSTQNTAQSTTEPTTQNSQAVSGKNEKKSNSAAVFAALAVIAVVAVLLVSFDLNGKNKKKHKSNRKKKSRK